MKVIPFHPESFSVIADHIKKQLPVILPTDTCYGFSGSIFSSYAIAMVERIKGRENKPFLILTENSEQMLKFGSFPSSNFEKKIDLYPSATTFLLSKTENMPKTYFPTFSEIGIRIPHTFLPLISFLHFLKEPLFSTSANKTGHPALYNKHDIIREFSSYPEILFASAGNLPFVRPSTLVRYLPSGEEEVLRK